MMQCEQSCMEYRVNRVQFTGTLSGSVRSLIDFFIEVAMKLIKLTQDRWVMVDDEDYHWLMQWKWHAKKGRTTYYAVSGTNITGKPGKHGIRMHRFILNTPDDKEVDHKNHNGLDNRRRNIRNCTVAENQHNQRPQAGGTSRFKGVCRWKGGKWVAGIYTNNKRVHLGIYGTEHGAAIAYDNHAQQLWGGFACLNFPDMASVE